MADKSYYHWPFFESRHAELAEALDQWTEENVSHVSHDDLDNTCRELVAQLAKAGWLKYSAPDAVSSEDRLFDVRALCLIREKLAYHSGLADFSLLCRVWVALH